MKKIILILTSIIFLNNLLYAQLKVSEKNGKYGYVDEKANIQIEHKYDNAEEFIGTLAKVLYENKKYFVDTLGTEYLLAEDFNELDTATRALHLIGKTFKSIPQKLYNFNKLKILIITNEELETISPEIGKLKDLTYLCIVMSKISSLPSEIGKLKKTDIFIHIHV